MWAITAVESQLWRIVKPLVVRGYLHVSDQCRQVSFLIAGGCDRQILHFVPFCVDVDGELELDFILEVGDLPLVVVEL